jgi:hypothetical protein
VSRKLSRRTFLGQLGGVTAASLTAGVAGVPSLRSLNPAVADAAEMAPTAAQDRRWHRGLPTHPAYPAGLAAIAGACATVLKAFFSESFIISNPVVASADGLSLIPYKGTDLTVGGKLNKLASNIALGRNTAGVHWRSDGIKESSCWGAMY